MAPRAAKKASFTEGDAVELLTRAFAGRRGSTLVGIGDDAAVVKSPRAPLVLTIDACVAGVHFDLRWLSLEDVGYRASQAAVSDLAGMGARPVAALANLCFPKGFGKRELEAVARGQAQALAELGCPMVGGNMTRGPSLSIETAVIGSARRPLLRSGARPGDELWLIGEVGLAGAGFACVSRGLTRGASVRACVARWRRPRALLELGQKLVGRATACCDVSDGLARDAAHLGESSGLCVIIEEHALSLTFPRELVVTARALGRAALELALGGGEDYALVCAGPRNKRPAFARRIGRFEQGRGALIERASGEREPLTQGFDHFA
jgi:thiamine-monophosphate kinase